MKRPKLSVPRLGRPQWRALAVLTVLFALCGLVVWQALELHNRSQNEAQQRSAVNTATAEVLDLTTLDPASVKSRLASLSSRATGDFKKQLTDLSSVFALAVASDKIVAKGQIDAVAVADQTPEGVTVLVAASTAITDKSAKQATVRSYRLRVSLVRSTGDAWLINGMEFVA